MLVIQTAGDGKQVCWSIKQLGYICRSNSCSRQAGMFVGQTALVGRQVC